MALPAVGQRRADGAQTQTGCAFFDQLQLVGVHVTREDISPVPHVDGQRKGLSARRGADVQYPVGFLRRSHRGDQPGCRVLHRKHALPESTQTLQIASAADLKAASHPRMGHDRRTGGPQFLFQRLRRGFHGVGLDGGGNDGVVAAEIFLCLLRAQNVDEPRHQPPGMAVPQRQVIRRAAAGQLRHIQPVGNKFPQHRIDHACRLGAAMTLGHLHRLVNGGAVGNFIHKQYLIGTDP